MDSKRLDPTPNGCFDRLLLASLAKGEKEFAVAMARESTGVLEIAHRMPVKGLRFGAHLVIGTPVRADVSYTDVLQMMDSDFLATRMVGAIMACDSLKTSTGANCSTEEILAGVRKARRVVADALIRHPYLLDSRIKFSVGPAETLKNLDEVLSTTGILRLPSKLDGYTEEQMVSFATHRTIFQQLKSEYAGIGSRIASSVAHNRILNAHAGYLEVYEHALLGRQQGRKPWRVSPHLMGDDKSQRELMAGGVGRLLCMAAWPRTRPGIDSTLFVDSTPYALAGLERVSRLGGDELMARAGEGFKAAIREGVFSGAINVARVPDMLDTAVQVGFTPSIREAADMAIATLMPPRPYTSAANVVPAGSGALLIEVIEHICDRSGRPQPFTEMHQRIQDYRAQMGDANRTAKHAEVEAAIEAAALQQSMHSAIQKVRPPSGSTQPPAPRRRANI